MPHGSCNWIKKERIDFSIATSLVSINYLENTSKTLMTGSMQKALNGKREPIVDIHHAVLRDAIFNRLLFAYKKVAGSFNGSSRMKESSFSFSRCFVTIRCRNHL
jgi:hypothetical protein